MYNPYNLNMTAKTDIQREKVLTIGEVSRLAGVNRETLRYYEREGVIEPPVKNDSGYRIYPPDAVKRIRFIKRAQELGFSLKEITELMALQNNVRDATCRDVKQYAVDKAETIEKKIADLQQMRSQLLELIASCDEDYALDACPILNAFEEG